jgi:hypothetical protein
LVRQAALFGRIINGSGHEIQLDKPQAVIDADF